MTRKSWIQIDGKLIPKEDFTGNNVRGPSMHIIPDIEPFVSPVTGEVISSRPQLREHNRANNVTNSADFPPEYVAKRGKERLAKQAAADKTDRINILKKATENYR
jgi:hypothetical protein